MHEKPLDNDFTWKWDGKKKLFCSVLCHISSMNNKYSLLDWNKKQDIVYSRPKIENKKYGEFFFSCFFGKWCESWQWTLVVFWLFPVSVTCSNITLYVRFYGTPFETIYAVKLVSMRLLLFSVGSHAHPSEWTVL